MIYNQESAFTRTKELLSRVKNDFDFSEIDLTQSKLYFVPVSPHVHREWWS